MEYSLQSVTESFEKYRNLRFPLKIWILVNANGNDSIRWNDTKSVVVVDRDALERYLGTAGSVFRFAKLSTFFWLMDFYGFRPVMEDGEGTAADDDKHVLQYRNDAFTSENRAYFEQLLRSRQLREVVNQKNGNCSVHQPRILDNQKQVQNESDGPPGGQSQLSSSSFAHEKFNLLMEMKSLQLSIQEAYGSLNIEEHGMVPVIEVPATYCDEPTDCVPEYVKKRVLAGNYGFVDPNDLKRFFGNYRPVYDDSPEANNPENSDEEPEAVIEVATEQPESPKPVVNTLDTFNYQEEEEEDKQFEPVDHSELAPLDSPMEVVGGSGQLLEAKNEENVPLQEAKSEAGDEKKFREESLDEAQFQLCAEIRETFELLNEF
ncbi:uncharacterized protein LOC120427291 [Culex pipiens pallens]|uniref:uncharacterized protein LOC120427291 n=1 Tax=Culex pipiens pallens TaxID=42434 RepID=UPI001952DF37|nr:uncharacterized protein LOC120427291 [Culex pipiens pallens]